MDDVDFTGAANPPLVPGYRMGEPLGQGSGGRVWSAVREVDRSPVAVKIVSGDPVALAREVDAARSLKIPHVVPVQGLVALDDGRFAVVMDVMGGGSVREVVATRGHLSAGEAITVLVPIAAALGALHAHGVVHGDVSPDNVLLDLRGRPALADLGASHALGQVDGDVWGSDGFVAPEVLLGSVPRAASDVYAVACLGLYLVTGTVPEVAPCARRSMSGSSRTAVRTSRAIHCSRSFVTRWHPKRRHVRTRSGWPIWPMPRRRPNPSSWCATGTRWPDSPAD